MSSESEVQALVDALVYEQLDAKLSAEFAKRVVRQAQSYKPSGPSPHKRRQQLTGIAAAMQEAVAAIDAATDDGVRMDTAAHLSAYAVNTRAEGFVLVSQRWDKAMRKHWPHIERVPPICALRAYLAVYATTARSAMKGIGPPRAGRPTDFERFRPVLYCAAAWRDTFGTKPGMGEESPFVRACRCALPYFGGVVPRKLHEHVREALRGVDIAKL